MMKVLKFIIKFDIMYLDRREKMGLTVQMAIKKNRLVIRLDGELDQSNVEELKKKVCNIIKKYSIVNLVFNFENLSFMDSTGIGFIIGRYGEIKRKGGSIVICSMNNTIKKVFNISGLKRICNVANDEVSADKILGVIA